MTGRSWLSRSLSPDIRNEVSNPTADSCSNEGTDSHSNSPCEEFAAAHFPPPAFMILNTLSPSSRSIGGLRVDSAERLLILNPQASDDQQEPTERPLEIKPCRRQTERQLAGIALAVANRAASPDESADTKQMTVFSHHGNQRHHFIPIGGLLTLKITRRTSTGSPARSGRDSSQRSNGVLAIAVAYSSSVNTLPLWITT